MYPIMLGAKYPGCCVLTHDALPILARECLLVGKRGRQGREYRQKAQTKTENILAQTQHEEKHPSFVKAKNLTGPVYPLLSVNQIKNKNSVLIRRIVAFSNTGF